MKKAFTVSVCGLAFCALFMSFMTDTCFAKGNAPPEKKIIDEWYAHLSVDLMLGGKVGAAAIYQDRVPWLFYFYPSLKNLPRVPVGGFNIEKLISMNPKYVILPSAYKYQAEILENANVPAVVLNFKDFAGLLRCVDQSAKMENTSLALERASAYRKFVTDIVGNDVLKQEETPRPKGFSWKNFFRSDAVSNRPRILHISSLSPLQADGTGTIIDEWIRLAGGQNAFSAKGNNHAMTWEQVFASNPDMIILAEGAGEWGRVPQAAAFLPAVKAGHLYRNPTGIFLWDRYGVELPLQLLWAREIIAGKSPNSKELKEKMRVFYKNFFNLDVPNSILEQILKGEHPPR